jgi:O-antigen/teichoic acid export membrane protein
MMFPIEIAGFYAMANRAAARPLDAASTSISNVLLRKTMGLRQERKPIAATLMKVIAVLITSGIPIFSVAYFFGEEILGWFLGARWVEAGRIVEILAPYFFFVLWLGSFTPAVFESLRLNKIRLRLHIGNLLVRISVFAYCASANLELGPTLQYFVVVSCAYQLLVFAIAARATLRHDRGLTDSVDSAIVAKG